MVTVRLTATVGSGEALPIGVHPGGLDLALPLEHGPSLPDGTEVDVVIDAGVAAFRTEAVVLSQRADDDAIELHLGWLDPERVRMRMPGAVREGLLEMQRRYGQPVRACLQPQVGRLLDLTATSTTLGVPHDRCPQLGDTVSVRLELGDGGPPAVPRGRVVAVHPGPVETGVTVDFIGPDGPLARLADRIHQVLASRRSRRGASVEVEGG